MEALFKIWEERILRKSTLAAIVSVLFIWWQKDYIASILNDYIHTPEFRGMLFGYISTFLGWMGITKKF